MKQQVPADNEWTAEEVASHDAWLASQKDPALSSEELADIVRQLESLKTKTAASRDRLKHAWKVFLERQKAVDQLGPGNTKEEKEKVDYMLNAIWSLEFRAQEYKADLVLLTEFRESMSLTEEGRNLPE